MYLFDFFRLVPNSRKIKIKRRNGVIFSNPGGVKRYIFYVSNLLVLGAVGLIIFIYAPVTKALVNFKTYQKKIEKGEIKVNSTESVVVADDKTNNEFMIFIPKILAEAKIIENVSPSDKKSFDSILDNGSVAMATGSLLPGSGLGSLTYLFSHSTTQDILGARKNAVFYLLGELTDGDQLYIYYGGEKYVYERYKSEVVGARETKYLNYSEEDSEIVILQTCWPLGTNWKRLLVFGRRLVPPSGGM
jgi:LPXTG-site transpeptidase (sortase) family protein